jgi:transcriptional regulator with XRE-family HTH domain
VSHFSENLRRVIFEKRLKAVDVARATKITPPTISRYLSGTHQPTTQNLIAISKYLEVSPESLLSSSEAPESSGSSRRISSDKDKIITAQEELVKSLQTQLTSQSHFIHALFKELDGAKAKIKEWEDWKASSKDRHAKGKAKANLAIAKNKNTLRINTTRKRKK